MPVFETSRGMKWYFEVEGDGPAVVFIHGWAVDQRIWRQQFKYFSRKCKVIGVDLPGHGKTTWQPLSLKEIAEDFLAIFKEKGLPKVHLVSSSFGGLVALKIYAIAPAMAGSLSFIGSQPKFIKSEDYPFGLRLAQVRKMAHWIETNYPDMINVFFRSLFTKEERATRRYRWIQTFRRAIAFPKQEALVGLLDIIEKEDLRDVLAAMTVPVLFIDGTEDYICQKGLFEFLKMRLPQAEFHMFERCGHFPFLTKPHEVNGILENFFKKAGLPL